MRLWLLLLLLLVHWAHADPPTLFRNCDAKDTLCYALAESQKKGAGDGLVRIVAADVAALEHRVGFELDLSNDKSWTFTIVPKDKDDQRSIDAVELVTTNGPITVRMADCSKKIEHDLYIASNQAQAPNCIVKAESVDRHQIKDPLADVFHLSYGQSVICLKFKENSGPTKSHCTEPIKFDAFNTDCQTNGWIGSGCDSNYKLCDQAVEQDNVFSCPDKEKNTLFLDKMLVPSAEARCTKGGWRTDDVNERLTGKHLIKQKASPQCVSLCDNYFIQSPDDADKDSRPAITDGVMTCKYKTQAPMIDGKLQLDKPIECAESKWTHDNKILEARDGIVRIKCARYIDQFVANECSSELQTEADSCGTFDKIGAKDGYLRCKENTDDALVLFKNAGHSSLFANMHTKEWEGAQGAVVGPIEAGASPYCVFTCSDVFLDLSCEGKQACSQANFTGEKVKIGRTYTYKSSLDCPDPDSTLIINNVAHPAQSSECEGGGWKWNEETENDLMVANSLQTSQKPISAYCHNACHESLILNDCKEEEAGCKKATINEENMIDCGDFAIEASADNLRTRREQVEQIFHAQVFQKLQCSKQGWTGDDGTVLDFAKYPQNDIHVNCRSKCSEAFVTCAWAPCPVKSPSSLKCENEGDAVSIGSKIAMQDLKCEPATGWLEVTSGKLIVNFATDSFAFEAKCQKSCTSSLIADGCAGHVGCEKPKLDETKLTCEAAGTVMRVNGQLELSHLTCSRESWAMSNPDAAPIPRTSFDETISVACLSKCDHSFIKASACVADGSCDPTTSHESTITCANSKDFVVANSRISSTPFSCDPLSGWSSTEGVKAADFSKNELQVEAHCFRNCDKSRIENVCDEGADCVEFVYKDDVLSCPAGFVLSVNSQDVLDNVQCEAGGFKAADSFLLAFSAANTQEKLRVSCVSKCSSAFVKLACDEQPCTLPSLSRNELSCADKSDLLVLGSTPVFSSSAHCDPLAGWKEGENLVHDFEGTSSVRVAATCRQSCNSVEIVGDQVVPYVKGHPLRCIDPRKYRLMLNGTEAGGEVSCDARGWLAKDGQYPLKHSVEATGAAAAECRHKCDASFVRQACASGDATCADAIYTDRKMSCAHASELLVIDGKESLSPLSCTSGGWVEEGRKDVVVEKGTTATTAAVQVHCLQLCHPDFVTLKDGASPFTYSLGEKLGCSNPSEMLVVQDKGVYADLVCDKQGWKREGESEHLFPFHASEAVRKITAGCEQNDCLSRGFAQPCGAEPTEECVAPNHTAYTVSCARPYALIPDMDSMIYVSNLHCTEGHWFDDQKRPIAEADETPMRLQCYAKKCATCGDSLAHSCGGATSTPNCAPPRHRAGEMQRCARYECDSAHPWLRVGGSDGSARYTKGDVTCNEAGAGYEEAPHNLSLVGATLDCVSKVPCDVHSPLDTSCEGLGVSCEKNFIDASEAAMDKPVVCKTPNQLYHYSTSSGWESLSSLRCAQDGNWEASMADGTGTTREIGKGERVICSSGDPSSGVTPDDATTADPEKSPCLGCRAAWHVRTCDGCTTYDDGLMSFHTTGEGCVAKSSSNVIELGDGSRAYDHLHCKHEEDGRYVWRTAEGVEVSEFAAQKMDKTILAGATKLGHVAGICVLIVLGLVVSALLVVWYRKREEQKKVASTTRGLEQKNDQIFDEISVDSVRTLRI